MGATFYEYVERERWLRDPSVRPNMEVFMLKIFMSMAVGIMGGLFLVNGRVLNSWKQLFRRFSARKQPLPAYLQQPHMPQPHHVHLHLHKHPPTHCVSDAHHRPHDGPANVHGYVSRNPLPPPAKHHHHSHSARHKCGSETQV